MSRLTEDLLPGIRVGIDMDEVSAQLEREGVDAFIKSFDELIEALEQKASELRSD